MLPVSPSEQRKQENLPLEGNREDVRKFDVENPIQKSRSERVGTGAGEGGKRST